MIIFSTGTLHLDNTPLEEAASNVKCDSLSDMNLLIASSPPTAGAICSETTHHTSFGMA